MTAQKTRRKPKSAGPKDAQPGNRNALRHGFYQKHFTAEENKRLDGTTDGLDILAVKLSRHTPLMACGAKVPT